MTAQALLEVRHLYKHFSNGGEKTTVLQDINLRIDAGEMVAIIGASGSGKSTLMNILGCLDRPSSGEYRLNGEDTATLNAGQRAQQRRELLGFIFQRYHLLPDLSARENVAMPSVYAGVPVAQGLQRADALLSRLGLGERRFYKPSQLSGGQQQRVSIARALMNGGRIIFADEPTGALDSRSSTEVMRILRELHRAGHTVILVTHDAEIARSADRIIELKDGRIIADSGTQPERLTVGYQPPGRHKYLGLGRYLSAFTMAFRAIIGHKLRAFLTMLGIIIGIASVVSVVALGQGAQQKILADISDLGSNTITIFPGKFAEREVGQIRTLTAEDAEILSKQSFVDSATPTVYASAKLRYDNLALNANITGVGTQFFQVQNQKLLLGRLFSKQDILRNAAVAVLDKNGAQRLFGQRNPPGQTVILNRMAVKVVGIVSPEKRRGITENNRVAIWLPYTSVMIRLLGSSQVNSITVRIADGIASGTAEDAIKRLLTLRHGKEDFSLLNADSLRQAITNVTQTLSLLISAIALISLVVGGIGVMNIMLVSVTERTQEIGIRMAVGARQGDILRQFLIEAVMLCLLGGALGIGLAFAIGQAVALINPQFTLSYSTASVITACLCSTAIGVLFGYLPARNAARLDPVRALTGD